MPSDPAPSHPDESQTDFTPSPLPAISELAKLGASLLPAVPRTPAEAVQLALKLWGAAIEHRTEHAVELARLECAADPNAAAARWHQWQLKHLGLEESAARSTAERRMWEARAAKVFKDVTWPAPFDKILRLIRDAPLDGNDARRHREFAVAWIDDAQRVNRDRLEWEWDNRKPREWHPSMSALPLPGTPHQQRARMQKDLDAALRTWQAAKQAEIEAEDAKIETTAAALRTEEWSQSQALHALRLWKTHTVTTQRRAAGRKPKKAAGKR